VENRSGKRMIGSSVRLVQKIIYYGRECCDENAKTVKNTLFVLNGGPFSETETWDRVRIPIPATVPAILQHCSNIKIVYCVEVCT
jgi:hypothetical protein